MKIKNPRDLKCKVRNALDKSKKTIQKITHQLRNMSNYPN